MLLETWFYLAPPEQEGVNDSVKRPIDESCKDFWVLDNWLAKLEPQELQSNPSLHLYQEARNAWKPWVRDSNMVCDEIRKIHCK
jgi:hypothetical protein